MTIIIETARKFNDAFVIGKRPPARPDTFFIGTSKKRLTVNLVYTLYCAGEDRKKRRLQDGVSISNQGVNKTASRVMADYNIAVFWQDLPEGDVSRAIAAGGAFMLISAVCASIVTEKEIGREGGLKMTIKEVETLTGLSRSNIRFYEKERLLSPARDTSNGYRDYSEADINTIKKVAYLRTLGISVEDIRRLAHKEAALYDVVKRQKAVLDQQLSEMEKAKSMCELLLSSGSTVDYDSLDIEQYLVNEKTYWTENGGTFKMDSISFFYMWGGNIVWGILTVACLLAAVFSFDQLPAEIPVQWAGGAAASFVGKQYIFAFPLACIIARFPLRAVIWQRIGARFAESDAIADYIINFICFAALSTEIFILLYVHGIFRHVTVVLFADAFVFTGVLLMAAYQAARKKQ